MAIDHDEHAENEALAHRMTALLMRGMQAKTRWALYCALGAAEQEGVVGALSITIPPGTKAFIAAEFRTDIAQPMEIVGARRNAR